MEYNMFNFIYAFITRIIENNNVDCKLQYIDRRQHTLQFMFTTYRRGGVKNVQVYYYYYFFF
jgi:hypothetical protein